MHSIPILKSHPRSEKPNTKAPTLISRTLMAQAHTLMLQTSLWWQASHPACPLGSLCGALAVHLKQLGSGHADVLQVVPESLFSYGVICLFEVDECNMQPAGLLLVKRQRGAMEAPNGGVFLRFFKHVGPSCDV
eukprot:1154239-Pelagomonas_calceolata.AAC.17